METAERFTRETIGLLADEIAQHQGNEVFAVGNLDRDGLVWKITVVARGTETHVPALRSFAETGDVVIHNHPSGALKPSGPDVAIASQLGDLGIGFYIVDNKVRRVTVVAEPVVREERKPLDIPALAGLLAADGGFSRIYADYEEREPQIRMLEKVCAAFNRDELLAAEAGTGVGKSLAYLIPAFSWVGQNRERVVISTATINLQEQLIEKDIPLVQKLFDRRVAVVLVKGRGNYLCQARLAEAIEEHSLFDERNEELNSIREWALTSKTGSRNDLSFYPSDQVWSEICSESDSCLGLHCRFRENCFVLKLRREAAKAQILVVNHHLLFSDTAVRLEGGKYSQTAVLPPFQRIIFDEAHNIEKSATSFFSSSMSKFSLRKITNRIHRERRGRVTGLARNLQKLCPTEQRLKRIPDLVRAVTDAAENVNALALNLVSAEKSVGIRGIGMDRLKNCLFDPLKELQRAILDLVNLFEDIFNDTSMLQEDENTVEYEIRLQLRRILAVCELVKEFPSFAERRDKVFWLESFKTHRGELAVRLFITPLDISAMMREAVFSPYDTVVFTSATLRVASAFTYWEERIGLARFRERTVVEGVFPSPFPFRDRVLVAIPTDAPLPESEGYEPYLEKIVLETLSISGGRALVLFTSYDQMNRTFQTVQGGLTKFGIPVLKQGDDERSRIFHRFNAEASSVLFATDSFWQGIDSPGETLEVVILCRLPFRVPTEPIMRERLARIEETGGNPFMDLSLPDAIMRFRQGFGRLMRKKTDKGVVLILDGRVVKKSYGRYFLESLPETGRVAAEGGAVLQTIESFFNNFRSPL